MQNFPQPVQASLSQKEKTFSGFFIAFLKCESNLDQSGKKDEYPSLFISRIIDFAIGADLNT